MKCQHFGSFIIFRAASRFSGEVYFGIVFLQREKLLHVMAWSDHNSSCHCSHSTNCFDQRRCRSALLLRHSMNFKRKGEEEENQVTSLRSINRFEPKPPSNYGDWRFDETNKQINFRWNFWKKLNREFPIWLNSQVTLNFLKSTHRYCPAGRVPVHDTTRFGSGPLIEQRLYLRLSTSNRGISPSDSLTRSRLNQLLQQIYHWPKQTTSAIQCCCE